MLRDSDLFIVAFIVDSWNVYDFWLIEIVRSF